MGRGGGAAGREAAKAPGFQGCCKLSAKLPSVCHVRTPTANTHMTSAPSRARESHTAGKPRNATPRRSENPRRARGSRDDGRAMNYASSGRAGFSLFDVSVAADPQTSRARRGAGGGARAPGAVVQLEYSPVFESRALEAGKRLQMTSTIRTARYEREASTLSPSPMRCV